MRKKINRRDVLMRLASLPPTPLEAREKLEQLRALENGIAIGVAEWHDAEPLIEVDTPEDLELARRAWAAGRRDPRVEVRHE